MAGKRCRRRNFRWKEMAVLTAVSVLLTASAGASTGETAEPPPRTEQREASTPTEAMEEAIRQRIDAIRVEQGLPSLAADKELARLAREYSRRMAEESFFSHTDPSGRSLVDRLQEAGIPYRAAGENIFRSFNVPDPVQAAVEGWLRSPGHRANILGPQFRSTGIGIWRQGEHLFFTQIFLRRP